MAEEKYCPELSALAIATTVYHEASPDMMEEARLRYSLALDRFRAAQSALAASGTIAETSAPADSEFRPLS